MILKSDAKFEEKLTLASKITWGTWWILMRAVASLKIWILMCNFVESVSCLSQKRAGELRVITLKNDAKFEEELTCALKNSMKNVVNFDPTLESFKICFLMGSF